MRFRIQTPMREVTQIVTDCGCLDYDDIKAILVEKDVPMDGFLIECKSKIGYVWMYKKPPVVPLTPPLDAARA